MLTLPWPHLVSKAKIFICGIVKGVQFKMKHFFCKLSLTTVVICALSIATVPAHATLSGSDPRPHLSSGSQGAYVDAAMAVFGF
jgi:hypothetical protein